MCKRVRFRCRVECYPSTLYIIIFFMVAPVSSLHVVIDVLSNALKRSYLQECRAESWTSSSLWWGRSAPLYSSTVKLYPAGNKPMNHGSQISGFHVCIHIRLSSLPVYLVCQPSLVNPHLFPEDTIRLNRNSYIWSLYLPDCLISDTGYYLLCTSSTVKLYPAGTEWVGGKRMIS